MEDLFVAFFFSLVKSQFCFFEPGVCVCTSVCARVCVMLRQSVVTVNNVNERENKATRTPLIT